MHISINKSLENIILETVKKKNNNYLLNNKGFKLKDKFFYKTLSKY